MTRRVWVITKKEKIEDSDIASAVLNSCPEIANGIPAALAGIITEGMLPCAYEEPEPASLTEPPLSTHIAILEAVDATKARPARVKRTWQGQDSYYDCFATQTVKDEFVAGEILIGDYVLVHFDEMGEQIVTAKVFKSW